MLLTISKTCSCSFRNIILLRVVIGLTIQTMMFSCLKIQLEKELRVESEISWLATAMKKLKNLNSNFWKGYTHQVKRKFFDDQRREIIVNSTKTTTLKAVEQLIQISSNQIDLKSNNESNLSAAEEWGLVWLVWIGKQQVGI